MSEDTDFRPNNIVLTSIGLALATFMQVLDTTIANVSLPTIAGNLGVSSDQSTWVITAFTVSNAIALPLTGFLSRRFGEVRLFVAATLLFSLASFLCGTAHSMTMLVALRAVQGAVAGPMYPLTQSMLISIYPPQRRPQAVALLSMVTVVAPIAGPILGGWITDDYSWPWIFFINVPIGMIASAIVWQQMRTRRSTPEKLRIDYVGLVTLVIGVGALQVMLDKGNDLDWFESGFIVSLGVIAAIFLSIFVIWEMTDAEPIVDLKLFRHRNFAAGTLAMVLGYAAFFGMALLLPLWLQENLSYTATWAGFATAPLGVLPVLLTPFVGKYAARFDLRILAAVAFGALSVTSFMRSDFTLDVDFFHVAFVQFLTGIGVVLFFMPVLTILLSDLQPSEISAGSGLATFLRTLGGSFAASLSTWIWDRRAAFHHARLAEGLTIYAPTTQQALHTLGPTPSISEGVLNQLVTAQGLMLSTIDYFDLLGYIFAALAFVVWLAKPPFMARGAAAAGH